MHISFCFVLVKTVEHLNVCKRAQSCNGENLRLTSCEKSRTVSSGQKTDFRRKRTDFQKSSAVNPLVVFDEPFSHNFFLKFIETFAECRLHIGILLRKMFVYFVADFIHLNVTCVFVGRVERFFNFFVSKSFDFFIQIVVNLNAGIAEFRFADFFCHIINEIAKFFDFLVSGFDSFKHNVLGNFLCACFNHNNLFSCSGNCKLKVAFFTLCKRGVYNDFAVNKTHKNACNGTVKRNIRNSERRACAYHSGNFG